MAMAMAMAMALVLTSGITVAHAESQAPRTNASAQPRAAAAQANVAPRPLPGVLGDPKLVACFAGIPADRRVDIVVAITIERGKLRARIKQSKGSTAVIDRCVTRVFDQLAVKLPPGPLERPIEIPVRYLPAGA